MRLGNLFTTTLALLGLLLIGGCAGLEEDRRNSNFGLQNLSYENSLRWGEYKTAAAYIKPGTLDEPIDYEIYDKYQVTDYKVRNTVRSEDGNTVTLDIRINYVRKNTVSVRQVDMDVIWEFDETTERWWMLSSLPKFE